MSSESEPNFKAFSKILSFMNALNECFCNDFPEVTKYYSLCKKTTLDNHKAIHKQNQIFSEYLLLNKDCIKSGELGKLSDAYIAYNPKIFFSLKQVISKADKQTIGVITKHLQVILVCLHPDQELKTSLVSSNSNSSSSSTSNSKEEDMLMNIIDKFGDKYSGANFTNVGDAMNEMKTSGVMEELATSVSTKLATGDLDPRQLIQTAGKLFSKVKDQTTDDPQFGGMINMVESLLSNAMSSMGDLNLD